jgi:hypothetical protein
MVQKSMILMTWMTYHAGSFVLACLGHLTGQRLKDREIIARRRNASVIATGAPVQAILLDTRIKRKVRLRNIHRDETIPLWP